MNGVVADDAFAGIDFALFGFELWFDQGDETSAYSHELPNGGEHFGERDEGEVHDDERVVIVWEVAGLEMPGVGFLHVGDAFVLAQFVMELRAAYIDTGGADRAAP